MAWKVDDADVIVSDLAAIYDHLVQAHRSFGHSLGEAMALAEQRVAAIHARRLIFQTTPHCGTLHKVEGLTIRHTTIDRAIYWFTLDEATETVRIEGIFHGGQDHLGRMLSRLTAEGGA